MKVTRRSLLALGAGGLLAACGSKQNASPGSSPGSSSGGSPGGTGPSPTAIESGFVVVQRYPNTSLTPGAVRLPIGIATPDGSLQTSGPAELTGRILDAGGSAISTFTLPIHATDIVVPYWAVEAVLTAPGIYGIEVDGAVGEPTPFQLFDPAQVVIPTVGAELPGFDTPTLDDARGVDPICTLEPPCPFHEVTLTNALAAGKPVVYIVGTPAHCATGTCAPGLEFLVELAAEYADAATFVHAEVYADNAATEIAPAVRALAIDYEPLVFVTDASGVVRERIDIIWDRADMAAALGRMIS